MWKYMIIGAVLSGWAVVMLSSGDTLHGLGFLAWPFGAVVGFVAWASFHPGARAARRVEQYRPQAALLRETDPETYIKILEQPGGREAAETGNAEAYVALFLAALPEPSRAPGMVS
jgi:hypothetical protein